MICYIMLYYDQSFIYNIPLFTNDQYRSLLIHLYCVLVKGGNILPLFLSDLYWSLVLGSYCFFPLQLYCSSWKSSGHLIETAREGIRLLNGWEEGSLDLQPARSYVTITPRTISKQSLIGAIRWAQDLAQGSL